MRSPLLNTTGLLVLHAATFLYFVATVLVDVVIGAFVGGWMWGCRVEEKDSKKVTDRLLHQQLGHLDDV